MILLYFGWNSLYISKKVLDQTWKSFNIKFGFQEKDWQSTCQVRQILKLFWKLVDLILAQNSVKGLTVTKIVKQIKLEEVWGELETKNCLRSHSSTNYLKQTQFSYETAHYSKVQFLFPRRFLLVVTKFSCRKED